MIVTFVPDEGDKQTWTFKPDRLLTTEAEAVERVTGQTYSEFGASLMNGGVTARRALVWIMRKRNGEPGVAFRDVDFPIGALSLELDDEEKALVRDAVTNDHTMSDEDKATAIAELGDLPDPKEAGSLTVDGG